MPVTWDELPALKSADQWNIVSAIPRLQANSAAWKDFARTRQGLGSAMRALGVKPKGGGR
jgi:bifunctional non-homologous end joining protein LigD